MTVRIQIAWAADGTTHTGTATTLGAGGLFVETDQPVRIDTSLKLRFRIVEGLPAHEIEARVTWKTDPQTSGRPGFGVQFTDPPRAARIARELEALAAATEATL